MLSFEKAIFQAAGIAEEDHVRIRGFARVDQLDRHPDVRQSRVHPPRHRRHLAPNRDRPAQ
jgi:hypothetical protein